MVGVIVAQIRALFGLPPMFVKNSKTGTYGVPAAVTGIADWFAARSLSRIPLFFCYICFNGYVICLSISMVPVHTAMRTIRKLALIAANFMLL